MLRQGADVAAADEDAHLLRVGVAHDEADEGGFAVAAAPDQCGQRAFGDVQVDAAQHGFGVGIVVVVDVFKGDVVPRGRCRFANALKRGDGKQFLQARVTLLHHAVDAAHREDLSERLGKADAGNHQRGEQPEDGSAVVARAQRQADGDEQGNAEPVG